MEVKDEKKSPYPVLSQIECKACGRCIISCPKGCLEMSKEVNQRGYHYVVYTGTGCSGCANCFYSCPEPNAIEVHIPQKG